jgi:hypothetical protein
MKRQATIQNGILNKYRSLFDSKEETGLCYMIYSDNLYSIDHKKLQTRAIHAMDWFIEVINKPATLAGFVILFLHLPFAEIALKFNIYE